MVAPAGIRLTLVLQLNIMQKEFKHASFCMKRYEILSALFTHSSKVIFSYSHLGDNRAWFPSKYWISGERQGMEKKKNCEVDTYEEKEFHFVDIMLNFFTLDM